MDARILVLEEYADKMMSFRFTGMLKSFAVVLEPQKTRRRRAALPT
jgi:hypothetical protein